MPAVRIALLAALCAVSAAGCSQRNHENRETVAEQTAYQAQYRKDDMRRAEMDARNARSIELNARRCTKGRAPSGGKSAAVRYDLLSAGDLLRVSVGDDETFSGEIQVNRDGTLRLPHMAPIAAHGRTVDDVEADLRQNLVAEGFYRVAPQISLRMTDHAPARVNVAGAVFTPQTVTVGGVSGQDRDIKRQEALGASTDSRTLTMALAAAGGVRPDADLSRVRILRGDRSFTVDARPALDGRRFHDIMVLADDAIEVPSRGCFQDALMVPSPITAPGVRVFMSNLTKPADSNAQSAISKDTRELRYGTRFIQAVVGMNCVGGTASTNADRSAVLFSRNPITGESIVIERRIEDLLQRADRDALDPYLLPGDAIACYDSTVTNIVEVARSIGSVFGAAIPFLVL